MPSYQDLLSQGQQSYGRIMAGYKQALGYQRRSSRRIQEGYNELQSNVLAGLDTQGQARHQEIEGQYARDAAAAEQRLISSGLGNSTILSSLQRGYRSDANKAENALSEQVAGQKAGYMSSIGLAGLGYRGSAQAANVGILGHQLGYQAAWGGSLLNSGLGLGHLELAREAQQNQQMYGGYGGYGRGGYGGGGRSEGMPQLGGGGYGGWGGYPQPQSTGRGGSFSIDPGPYQPNYNFQPNEKEKQRQNYLVQDLSPEEINSGYLDPGWEPY